ncbi:PH domain-containing protein [Chondrinema litorale]|uniref:PH domain-containing protein n=1 Tax=Chondrinema litorale TaxID=2994555 RepID=UPI0025428F3D|nr:PH domain-containing protein [Chondrinema litorale]UZS00073.1 PH domain-containing protein [Chondrinema litorale]
MSYRSLSQVNDDEEVLWSEKPSQILNLKSFFISSLSMIISLYVVVHIKDIYDKIRSYQKQIGIEIIDIEVIFYFIAIIFFISVFYMFSSWLRVYMIEYKLTTDRLFKKHGIFKQEIDELELYRIKDYTIISPFISRLFSVANIRLDTSDKSHSVLYLMAIKDTERVNQTIRKQVEILRSRKGVREID